MLRAVLVLTVACSREQAVVDDTDEFAPDHPSAAVKTTHIARDLVGTWGVRVPDDQRRKFEVLRTALGGASVSALDPPITPDEEAMIVAAADLRSPLRDWYRCANDCRFEITDASVWNYGFYPYSPVGSGLMSWPEIEGREVRLTLAAHDPIGRSGTIELRMNPSWTAFRVFRFELDGYTDPDLASKLELVYAVSAP